MQELLDRKKGLHRKILLVDDEFIEREMLGNMLKDAYEIVYAGDGEAALDTIKKEKYKLSLVILDLHMPKLDGYGLLKILHSDPELRRIPVIVLTSEKEAEVKSLQLGAADFITKPYEVPEVIQARVRHSIELAESSVIIHETERDELTGLFHKEFFFEYGRQLDEQSENMPMDAIVIDVNRFHLVNELYGREFGDSVLKTLGENIHGFVEETGGLACRSDSNCFYIYIPHQDDLKEVLSRQVGKIDEIFSEPKIALRVGAYSDDGSGATMEQRFDCARLACGRLSKNYETSYGFYSTELHDSEVHSEQLIQDMDKALAEKQFKVFFQPKYNIEGDKPVLCSAEALIRWFHPAYGMVSPGEFISLFEEKGLIHKLDRYVWNEAAARIKEWKDKFGVTVPVSVNVSRVDVFDPLLGETLEGIVKNNGIRPVDLLLEITESAYTDNSQQVIDAVKALRDRGFKVEMDDFGSGYSSLNMLTSLPIDALKLDMKFIRHICENKKDFALVEIMIKIADLLEVPIIAEGVETGEQMEMLKSIGCEIIQGYYFSKPVPPEEFEKFIEKA